MCLIGSGFDPTYTPKMKPDIDFYKYWLSILNIIVICHSIHSKPFIEKDQTMHVWAQPERILRFFSQIPGGNVHLWPNMHTPAIRKIKKLYECCIPDWNMSNFNKSYILLYIQNMFCDTIFADCVEIVW